MKNRQKQARGRKVSDKETITIRMSLASLTRADELAHALSRGQLRALDRNDVIRAAVEAGLGVLAEKVVNLDEAPHD